MNEAAAPGAALALAAAAAPRGSAAAGPSAVQLDVFCLLLPVDLVKNGPTPAYCK